MLCYIVVVLDVLLLHVSDNPFCLNNFCTEKMEEYESVAISIWQFLMCAVYLSMLLPLL